MRRLFSMPFTRTPRAARKTLRRSRPRLEHLEDRLTPDATVTVPGTAQDLVFDGARNHLYVTTSQGALQRIDVNGTPALLSSWSVGNILYGADTTPDHSFLYVADGMPGATGNFIRKVNLDTGAVTNLPYSGGSGAWDLVVLNNGKAFFDSRFAGSGWVALNQIDLATDTISVRLGSVRQDTHLHRGFDGSLFFLTESNISSGPIQAYYAATDTFSPSFGTSRFHGSVQSAVNRDGTLVAIEMSGQGGACASVMNRNLGSVENVCGADGGLAFDPVQDLLYTADSATDQLIAYDTITWKEKYRLPLGVNIGASGAFGPGVMRVDDTGTKLFLITGAGTGSSTVRVLDLPNNPGVLSKLSIAGFPAFTGPGTPGTFTVTALDDQGNVVTDYRGTVEFLSSDPSAGLPSSYTFTADDNGSHTFTAALATPGTNRSITVRDTSAPATLTATQSGIRVHDGTVALIPVAGARDHVYDLLRGVLYITTSAGKIERYQPATKQLLAPLTVGNSLYGIDITPDGRSLYVAEGQRGATQSFIRKVDLATGTAVNLAYGGTGAWDIAIASNGKALFDSFFEGSGWVGLNEINLSTDVIANRRSVRQNSNVSRGPDRSLFFVSESNISSGPIFTYDANTDSFPTSAGTGGFHDSALASVNRNGTRIGFEFSGGISIMNRTFGPIQNLSGVDGGLAFDPVRDVLYAVNSSTDQLIAFDSNTWSERSRIPVGENVGASGAMGSGVMTVSGDGLFVFLTTPSGVRLYQVAPTTTNLVTGTGGGPGEGPRVRVFEAVSGALKYDFLAFEADFSGGVRVATGDVTGDGIPDILAASGPGWTAEVKLYDGASPGPVPALLASGTVYGDFTGGMFVATGDLSGDGHADVILAPDAGALPGFPDVAPPLLVVSGADGALLGAAWPYGTESAGGVRVAAGDVNGDGLADLVIVPGPGRKSLVLVFSGTGLLLQGFLAYDGSYTGGAFVAVGDVTGDGRADFVVGSEAGSGPVSTVRLFDSSAEGAAPAPLRQITPYAGYTGEVHVALADTDGDSDYEIITGPGSGQGPRVKSFDHLSGAEVESFFAYGASFLGGVHVAG